MDKEKNKIKIAKIPELVRKQLKLLGLFFGTWALFSGNMFMLQKVIYLVPTNILPYKPEHINDYRNVAFIIISVFTILQMCAIYKYILKK